MKTVGIVINSPLERRLLKTALEGYFRVLDLNEQISRKKLDVLVTDCMSLDKVINGNVADLMVVLLYKNKQCGDVDLNNGVLFFEIDAISELRREDTFKRFLLFLRKSLKNTLSNNRKGNVQDVNIILRETEENKIFLPKDRLSFPHKLVLIGSSTGGPGLIEQITRSLPKNYPHAVCVIQHMPKGFTEKFAKRLNSLSALEVMEAENGLEVLPGRIIIAKSGFHLLFERRINKIVCKLEENTKGLFFIPSVNETFFSALSLVNPKNIVAVLLTGIGDDGADGMVALKKAGAFTIAESEESAAVYGMPKEAKERGGAVKVLHFREILKLLMELGN